MHPCPTMCLSVSCAETHRHFCVLVCNVTFALNMCPEIFYTVNQFIMSVYASLPSLHGPTHTWTIAVMSADTTPVESV